MWKVFFCLYQVSADLFRIISTSVAHQCIWAGAQSAQPPRVPHPWCAERQEGLCWLGWPRTSLFSYSMPFPTCPGSVVCGHRQGVQTQGAGQPGNVLVIPSSQHFFAQWFRGLVANLTGIISPYLGTGGEKCYWLHLQNKRKRTSVLLWDLVVINSKNKRNLKYWWNFSCTWHFL